MQGVNTMAKDTVFQKDEILSDNTHADYCKQCKACTMWGIGDDPYANRYDKGNCAMFPHPDHKPGYVINNEGTCPYRVPKEG